MSRGYDIEERGGDRKQEPEQVSTSSPAPSVGPRDRNARRDRQQDRRAIETETKPRWNDRAIERWSAPSESERGTLREIGRFRSIDAEALLESRYCG